MDKLNDLVGLHLEAKRYFSEVIERGGNTDKFPSYNVKETKDKMVEKLFELYAKGKLKQLTAIKLDYG